LFAGRSIKAREPERSGVFVPGPDTLAAWDQGVAISDDDLAAIEVFFGWMVGACEALGERYAMATTAFRTEHDRATRMQGYRSTR
jgi:hypothetical protein